MRSRRCPVRGLPVWRRRCLPRQIRVAQRSRSYPRAALLLPFRARPTTCVVIPGSAGPMALTEFTTGWCLVPEDSFAGPRSRHGCLYNCGGTRVACGSLGSSRLPGRRHWTVAAATRFTSWLRKRSESSNNHRGETDFSVRHLRAGATR